MEDALKRRDQVAAIRIVAIYAGFAALWIYFSDTALGSLAQDTAFLVQISVIKGLLFILVTGLLLYQLLVRSLRKSREIERNLRLSDERLQLAMRGSSDGLWDWNLKTDEVYYSPRWKAMLGYAEGELENHLSTWKRLVHPDEAGSILSLVRDLLEGRTDKFEGEFRMRHKDGHYLHILSRGFLVHDEMGVPVRLLGTHMDISERKRMEDALLKSEDRYRRLVELSPLMVMVHQKEQYVYVNPATVKALGASKAKELLGKSIFEVIDPDSWDSVKERIQQLSQGKEIFPVEEKFIRLDGKSIDVELSYVQTLSHDEPVVLVIGRDITQQKIAEKEKAVLQEQLQQSQKMEAIGTLAGGVAHDFNNILSVIIGYAELTMLDMAEGSKARSNLRESIKACHRAKELVQQILAFSRQGKQERKPMDIRPVLKEGLKLLRASLPATIEIRQQIDADLGAVEADPTQIHQILMNLCTNAGHAMGEKGGVLEVCLTRVNMNGETSAISTGIAPGPYLRLRVSDTGHGMTPEILERIFDPYFTTKEVGKGTGLGLAVVHGIVKSYGGGITVASQAGKGSTFDVYFPRVEAPEPAVKAQRAEPLPLGGNERVLFVDDEKAIVEVGQEFLDHLGYETVVRTSSLEAMELFRAKPDQFDLVITDMTMPNMTGDKLAREILKIRPEIPIILCTGFSELMTEEKAKALGIREFVMKPMVMKEIAQAVRRALDGGKKRKG